MMRAGRPGGVTRKSRGRLKSSLLVSWALMSVVAIMWAGGWLGAAEPAAPATSRRTRAPWLPSPSVKAPSGEGGFQLWGPLFDSEKYPHLETAALVLVLLIAVAGLIYAGMLVKQVKAADQGTAPDARDRPGRQKGRMPIWALSSARLGR